MGIEAGKNHFHMEKPLPHLEVEGEGGLKSRSRDIWLSLRQGRANVRVEENVCVLRDPFGGSQGVQLEGPLPEVFGRSSRHLLHYNRPVVHGRLSSTLTALTTPKRVSRTFLRCLVGIFFSAFLRPVLLQFLFPPFNPALSRTENSRVLFFIRFFPAHVSPNWFSDIF